MIFGMDTGLVEFFTVLHRQYICRWKFPCNIILDVEDDFVHSSLFMESSFTS